MGLEVWLSGSNPAVNPPGSMGWGHGLSSMLKALDLIFSAKNNKQKNKKSKGNKNSTPKPRARVAFPLRRDQLSVWPHPSVA